MRRRGRSALVLVGYVAVGAGLLARGLGRELEQLGQAAVVLLEQGEGAEGLGAGGCARGIGELAGGEGMLVDGDGGVGSAGGDGGRSRMVVGLAKLSAGRESRREAGTGLSGAAGAYLD